MHKHILLLLVSIFILASCGDTTSDTPDDSAGKPACSPGVPAR